MTKADILTILYQRLNYATSPDATVVTRIGASLNQAYRSILRQPGIAKLRDTPANLTFASESGLNYYGLPAALSQVRTLTDRTNDRKLWPLSWDEIRTGDPALRMTGTPYGYIDVGVRQIARLPATTGLWIVSSSASDTTQVVQINGIRTGGVMSGDISATINGVTRVALGTFTDYIDVSSVSMSVVAVGVISIYDAATVGNVIATIPISHVSPLYQGVYLYPTPTAAVTYYADGPTRILDLDDTVDIPLLPEEFHDLLIPATLMIEYEKADDPRFQHAAGRYNEGLSALKFRLSSGLDEIPILGARQTSRASRLGGMYPAD